MCKEVYAVYSDLPDKEKEMFIHAIERDKSVNNSNLAKLLDDIREARFSEGLACVHCGSTSVVRHGKYRGRQRYKCKDCSKPFNDMTITPISGTH